MSNKFYTVSVSYKFEGIFAIVDSIINHSLYAKKQGLIPIIDMKNYSNQYFKDNKEYKDNVWEYFFEQPCKFSLEDIKEDDSVKISKNTFCIDTDDFIYNHQTPINTFIAKDKETNLRKTQYRELFRFNQETKEFLEINYKNLIKEDDVVLGILCRGTDYIRKKPVGEQIQPKPEVVIKKTKEVLRKYPEINKIYVATEDDKIYQMFKAEFKDILLENNQYKYSYDLNKKDFLSEIEVSRENHNYNLAKEYLSSVYILSKCQYFIGGRTTGTKWAWILADNWKYSYVWKLGSYGRSPLEKIFSVSIEDSGIKKYKRYCCLGIKLKCKIK